MRKNHSPPGDVPHTEDKAKRIRPPREVRGPNDGLRPYAALTHGIGALMAAAAAGVLIVLSAFAGGAAQIVSYSVYGATLIGLYTASTLYHCIPAKVGGRRALRTVDHIMIYMLIAGTYTPLCLGPLQARHGAWGWSVFGVIWGLAVAGSLVKLFWMNAPRWVSAAAYIGMGWMIIVAVYPVVQALSGRGLMWLALGGVFYTAGGVLYARKWPGRDRKYFGFHEVFHIFIMLGSVCHYAMMVNILYS
ncbi:MAG: hemolysin III family protein [Oscillospiraceae bacterium]|nr:hemolysin III family protein [Oscillospiraceae bacterium]